MTKRLFAAALAAALSLALGASLARADEKQAGSKDSKELKTVSGTSACAMCDGMPVADHAIMIQAKDGTRWVLVGGEKSEGYKKAFEARMDGKQMVAPLAGTPETKKDSDGKEYKQVKISDIKIKES